MNNSLNFPMRVDKAESQSLNYYFNCYLPMTCKRPLKIVLLRPADIAP